MIAIEFRHKSRPADAFVLTGRGFRIDFFAHLVAAYPGTGSELIGFLFISSYPKLHLLLDC